MSEHFFQSKDIDCMVLQKMNTYSNRRVANHLHGLIFELKERMDSRQDRPVMNTMNVSFSIIRQNRSSVIESCERAFDGVDSLLFQLRGI